MKDRLFLIADFNIETLARYLAHTALPHADVEVAPYGQVTQSLAGAAPGENWSAVVWTLPHLVSDTFRRAAAFETANHAPAVDEVRAFAESLRRYAHRVRHLLVPTWVLPSWYRGYGMLEWQPHIGLTQLLARMNLALAEAVADIPNVCLLDTARWQAAAGPQATTLKPWYAAKVPFGPALVEEAGRDIAAALDALAGRARRLLIVDLDDVLWGGVVGEVGWEGIRLGGHDYIGEAFADFQRGLKQLARRGVQLAIASKNDEAAALEAFDRHPEMVLKREDFVAWRINWLDKAQNVAGLLRDANFGAESAVFIDDNPVERDRIRTAVPGVLTPDWPDDPTRYREALAGLRCFDTAQVTLEDRQRSAMYAADRVRRQSLEDVGDLESWLQSLETTVTAEPLTAGNLTRACQLLNKTNQFNLTTRRMSQAELEQWAAGPANLLLTFRVADRFGDSGLSGLVGLTFGPGGRATLADLVLSCRVMGRSIEETLLHVAVSHSRARHASPLVATLVPTARNAPCADFLNRSGLQHETPHSFRWDTSRPYPLPPWITLEDRTAISPALDR
jgi:FkbH-like protein